MRKLTLLLITLVTSLSFSQTDTTLCKRATLVLETIKENHYKPKPIDDHFSSYIFNAFLKRLDKKRILYSKDAIDKLSDLEYKLDDYILAGDCTFINDFVVSYETQLKKAQQAIKIVEKSRLDFTGKDTITYGTIHDASVFSNSEKTLQKRWSKKIRLEIVEDYLSLSNPSNFNKIQAQIKSKIIAQNNCYVLDKIQAVQGIETYIANTFLDVVCKYFDPHSSYFDPTDKTDFLNSIATETNSIGIWFTKNSDGKIIVAGLQTGSIAWKEKKINAGDLVLSFKSNDEVLNTTCLSLQNLYDFINDDSHKVIEINFLDEKNVNKTITFKKESLKIEENAVNSFILKGDYNIGYISLPSFYTNVDYGFGSANDIAKELFKLNAVEIDGLILDLRDNGGGSMKQAVDLAGMFIDKGPLGIYRDQKNNKTIIKDFNRGTLFTKPLVILINNSSASASEFITAALKDHNRAIIVGSKSYGKGTIQSVFPLAENEGFVKVTIEKMYGFTGNTHQATGITPHIEFPSMYAGLEDGEASNSNFIENDTVLKDVYFNVKKHNDYAILLSNSNKRSENNTAISTIKNINSDLLKYVSTKRKLPLSVKGIKHDKDFFNSLFDRSKDVEIKHASFEVVNLEDYKEILEYNKNKAYRNEYEIKNIQTDYEIEESYQIIADYIKQLAN